MAASTARITFGNDTNVLAFAPYSADHLIAYSNAAEAKLKVVADASSTGSEASDSNGLDAIFFDTCDDVCPVVLGMETILKWMLKHPSKGYPATYKGRKQLTVEVAEKLYGGPIPLIGLLRTHEALLLLNLKNHLGGQFVIRKAIVEHINTTILSTNEFHKIGMIFSHPSTLDTKLVQYAVNKTLDFMDANLANGALSQDGYDAYWEVSEAVPILADKMDTAYAGKQDRLAREVQKAARAAERLAAIQEKRAAHKSQPSARFPRISQAFQRVQERQDPSGAKGGRSGQASHLGGCYRKAHGWTCGHHNQEG